MGEAPPFISEKYVAQLGWQLAGSVHHCLYMVSMNCAEVPLSSLRAGVVREQMSAERQAAPGSRRAQPAGAYDIISGRPLG